MSYDLTALWDPQASAIVVGDDADKQSATNKFAATSDMVAELSDDEPGPRWRFWKR